MTMPLADDTNSRLAACERPLDDTEGAASPIHEPIRAYSALQLPLFGSAPDMIDSVCHGIPENADHQALSDTRSSLTTVDLFCGAGGLTEGFRQAGFTCLYGNDCMGEAIATFRHNHPRAWGDGRDIRLIDPSEVRTSLGIARGALDVLVGGPPCQGFSINAPERFLEDPRNELFLDYIRFVDAFQPRALLFENVPGLLSLGDGRVLDLMLASLNQAGYETSVRILFAPHYGVPQERWRLIVLGSRHGVLQHPEPTHYAVGRANFRGGRSLTYQCSALGPFNLKPCVSVGEALSGLPRLQMGEGAEEVHYSLEPMSEYARSMRNPDGSTYNHYASRLSAQNVARMQYVKPGGSWRDIPHDLLPKGMQRARTSDHTKRYGRLTADGLACTVLTKCDPHWGAVFLPDQDRALTVREAARLQSFPDAYRFLGPRVAQYEQVGNAVPVLMARALALSIRAHLVEAQPFQFSDALVAHAE